MGEAALLGRRYRDEPCVGHADAAANEDLAHQDEGEQQPLCVELEGIEDVIEDGAG